MNEKARKYMVGYQNPSTNYKMYNPETDKMIVSRNVIFDEIPCKLPLTNISSEIRFLVNKDVPDESQVPKQQDEENEELFTAMGKQTNRAIWRCPYSPTQRVHQKI